MDLEKLLLRAKEIDNAIVNTNNQLQNLLGARAENQHSIKEVQASSDESTAAVADNAVPVVDLSEESVAPAA